MADSKLPAIRFSNGVAIDLIENGSEFLGLGSVSVANVTIRSGERPAFIEIRNPGGVQLANYRVISADIADDVATIRLTADKVEGGPMEWMVHEVRNRYATSDWTATPTPASDTLIELIIRSVTRTIGGIRYEGFSYQYGYESETIPIYKILDRGTWELGGHAVGNEFWMRNCFVPAITEFGSVEESFSTEWYIPDAVNPSVFQFLPLQTELQGFTFTASDAGTLITWPTEVAHVRSLFEKPAGDDVIVHWHEHCGDLANSFTTSPVEMLFAPGGGDFVERANRYEAARAVVFESLHAQLGMEEERITSYGQIEEWGPPDFDWYMTGLEKLLAAGIKTIYIANHFQNNMNTWGISNMCCTVDYKVAEIVGVERLRRFVRRAQEAGARVEMWGNTSIATTTVMFANREKHHDRPGRVTPNRIKFLDDPDSIERVLRTSKDPFVRNASNAIEADHYTPVFATLNLRDKHIHDYWVRRWSEAHDVWGLEGIFLDSSFNLSSDKFHYIQNTGAEMEGATADQVHLLGFHRPAVDANQAILSQYRAHLDLMTEMQKVGIRYCNEDLGVFGTHRHGPGVAARLDSLPIWNECIANFDLRELEGTGADPDAVYFKGLAYRMMWSLVWDIEGDRLTFHYAGVRDEGDLPNEWHLKLLRVYDTANEHMLVREILPNEAGVVYRGGGKTVLWAFEDIAFGLEAVTPIRELVEGSESTASVVDAKRLHVYVIG